MDENIENLLPKNLAELLREAVQRKNDLDPLRYFPAKVTAINDPKKLGRVRVRVYGVFSDDIPDDELPWAIPMDVSEFNVPHVGSLVNVLFENNDIYSPKYSGKVINLNNLKDLSAGYDEDYPESVVFFETENGDYFKINRRTLEMTFRHASGLIIKVNKSGDVTVDNKTTKNGSVNFNIRGDVNVSSNKSVTIQAADEITLKTADGSLWKPNVVDVCPFSGLPHGGPIAGISKLKGS